MSEFKVGDRVIHTKIKDYGTVVSVNGDRLYPITIEFDCGDRGCYKIDGTIVDGERSIEHLTKLHKALL